MGIGSRGLRKYTLDPTSHTVTITSLVPTTIGLRIQIRIFQDFFPTRIAHSSIAASAQEFCKVGGVGD